MKNSPLKQSVLFMAVLFTGFGLSACQTGKNAGKGSKCEECADCAKPASGSAKHAGSK